MTEFHASGLVLDYLAKRCHELDGHHDACADCPMTVCREGRLILAQMEKAQRDYEQALRMIAHLDDALDV